MKHHSIISSVLVYLFSTILFGVILVALYLGWKAMPSNAQALFGLIEFLCIAVITVVLFGSIGVMFAFKLHAQWFIDHTPVVPPKKLPVRRPTPRPQPKEDDW